MSVADLSNGVYYFNWVENPNIIWIELDRVDFSEGSGVRVLNPRKAALVGDVSGSFEKVR